MPENADPTSLPTLVNTPSGVIVGADAPRATSNLQFTPAPQAPAPQVPQGFFSADEIAKARQQEKDKLYPQLEEMRTKLELLQKEREERLAAEESLRKQAETEADEKRKAELTLKERVAQMEQEMEDKFRSVQEEREREKAILEHERRLMALNEYRQRRVNEERDNILPELLDLVSGGSEDEIDMSIAGLRERTDRILEGARQALAPQSPIAGARVTAPPAGPLDTNSENRLPSPDEIRAMDINEYQKYRDKLLGSTGGQRTRGLFG